MCQCLLISSVYFLFSDVLMWAHFAYFPAYSRCLDTNKGLTLLLYPHNPLLFIQMGIKPPIPTAGRWISRVSHTSAKSGDMWPHVGESFSLLIATSSLVFLPAACYRGACICSGGLSLRDPWRFVGGGTETCNL